MKHTEGPWEVKTATENISVGEELFVGNLEDGGYILNPICKLPTPNKHNPNSKANARLISSAPDLLEALIKWNVFMETNYTKEDISWWDETKEAIAKATE